MNLTVVRYTISNHSVLLVFLSMHKRKTVSKAMLTKLDLAMAMRRLGDNVKWGTVCVIAPSVYYSGKLSACGVHIGLCVTVDVPPGPQ